MQVAFSTDICARAAVHGRAPGDLTVISAAPAFAPSGTDSLESMPRDENARRRLSRSTPNGAVVAVLALAGLCSSFLFTLVVPIQAKLPELLNASRDDTAWVVTSTLLAASRVREGWHHPVDVVFRAMMGTAWRSKSSCDLRPWFLSYLDSL